jgi:hypothetical protein
MIIYLDKYIKVRLWGTIIQWLENFEKVNNLKVNLYKRHYMTQGKTNAAQHTGPSESLRILAGIALIIVVLAAISALFVPGGSSLQKCEGVVLEQSKNSCLYNLALSTKNSTLCTYMTGESEIQCYVGLAENTTNPQLCQKSGEQGDNGSEFSCIELIVNKTQAYSDCNYLNSTGRAVCLTQGAVAEYNQSLCGSIGNQTSREVCNDSVSLDLAVRDENQSYCGQIGNNADYNVTLGVLQASDADNYPKISQNTSLVLPTELFESGTGFSPRDYCYFALTAQSGDSAYCADVQNQNLAGDCISMTFHPTPTNETALQNFNFSVIQSACYNQTMNYSQCNITVDVMKAITYKNITYCQPLNGTNQDTCYIYVVQETHNASICSKILNLTVSNLCVQNASYNSTALTINGTTTPG